MLLADDVGTIVALDLESGPPGGRRPPLLPRGRVRDRRGRAVDRGDQRRLLAYGVRSGDLLWSVRHPRPGRTVMWRRGGHCSREGSSGSGTRAAVRSTGLELPLARRQARRDGELAVKRGYARRCRRHLTARGCPRDVGLRALEGGRERDQLEVRRGRWSSSECTCGSRGGSFARDMAAGTRTGQRGRCQVFAATGVRYPAWLRPRSGGGPARRRVRRLESDGRERWTARALALRRDHRDQGRACSRAQAWAASTDRDDVNAG